MTTRPPVEHDYEVLLPLFRDISLSWNEIVARYVEACPALKGKVSKGTLLNIRSTLIKRQDYSFPKRPTGRKPQLAAASRSRVLVDPPDTPRYNTLAKLAKQKPVPTVHDLFTGMEQAGFGTSASTIRGMLVRLREFDPDIPVRMKRSYPGTMRGL